MRYFLVCIFSFFISLLPAQVTGYLGKRFIAEIQPSVVAHNWILITKANWIVSPGLHLEYVTGRKSSWAVDYHFSRMKQSFIFPTEIWGYNGSEPYYKTQMRYLPVSFHHVGINYRYYFVTPSSWTLAPLGLYFSTGASTNVGIKLATPTNPLSYQLPELKNKIYYRLGIGSRNVLWHKVTLDYSINMNISTLYPSFLDFSDDNIGSDMYAIDEYNLHKVNESIRIPNFFTANVGIGWLLF